MAISDYLGLITSEHADKPKYMAWVTANLQMGIDTQTAANAMMDAFDIQTAVGNQLDILGVVIGQQRDIGVPLTGISSILTDTYFRLVLQARIAKNNWNGTIPQIYEIWNNIFPTSPLQLIDNQNMAMQAVITNLTDNVSQELVTAGLIVPKPMGVGLIIVANTAISEQAYLAILATTYDIMCLTTAAP
jgi:hypothetical protein